MTSQTGSTTTPDGTPQAPETPETPEMIGGIEPGAPQRSALEALRAGVRYAPEFTHGLPLTLALALVAMLGRVLVPIAVQQTIDRGLMGEGGPRPGLVAIFVLAGVAGVALTATCSYVSNLRLFRSTEAGLATLRTKAFRHVHDLSVLTQNTQRRGSLVSRVTSDVDTISNFMQYGGLMLILSAGQLVVATTLMAVYSWPLTLLVWACFLPLFLLIPVLQRKVSGAYGAVRERVGALLAGVSEAVVGADTIRAYGVQERTQRRVDAAIDAHRVASTRAQWLVAGSFTGGVWMSGLVVAAVTVAGTVLGVHGQMTLGRLLAVLFLVQLFVTPVQAGTEVLNELQNAAAGFRRVLGILDTTADVADPGDAGQILPRGPIRIGFEHVSFAYPGGPEVLSDVDLTIAPGLRVAIVGETGSGKTTMAKLLTRLMDPAGGRITLDGTDLRDVRFSSLRDRVVMVPQEGFLFDLTLAENIAWGTQRATRDDVERALGELGLLSWAQSLPRGLDTQTGQRGESLSAGERQLVALARAYLADPDLLVLDEATSAVDPATEVRLQTALEGVTRGRTSVAIAHRLSTAEASDLVIVVDQGRVVGMGTHQELLATNDIYARLHASWNTVPATV